MSVTPIAIRLTRGSDLKSALAELVSKHQIKAGSIASCAGCLSVINIRLANAGHTLKREEPFEIVSLMGTLTPDHQHVHISAADSTGRVWGGHLLEGCTVATTAELIVHRYDAMHFEREFDADTGYTELVIR